MTSVRKISKEDLNSTPRTPYGNHKITKRLQ